MYMYMYMYMYYVLCIMYYVYIYIHTYMCRSSVTSDKCGMVIHQWESKHNGHVSIPIDGLITIPQTMAICPSFDHDTYVIGRSNRTIMPMYIYIHYIHIYICIHALSFCWLDMRVLDMYLFVGHFRFATNEKTNKP
jgi:hypothetical protein